MRLSLVWTGRASSTPFVYTIAPREREKAPRWSMHPRPLPMGARSRATFLGKKIALCLEQAKGALINALLEYPFLVLYPINPATAARYRQAFKTSRAKDDPSDAQVCLELLLHHREKLTPALAHDGATRELSRLLEARRSLIDLRTLLTQHATRRPQKLLSSGAGTGWPGSLRSAGLSVPAQVALAWAAAESAHGKSVRRFYYAHNCRRMDVIEKRLHSIAAMIPLCRDPALIESAIVQVKMLARQLLQLGIALKDMHSGSSIALLNVKMLPSGKASPGPVLLWRRASACFWQ